MEPAWAGVTELGTCFEDGPLNVNTYVEAVGSVSPKQAWNADLADEASATFESCLQRWLCAHA